MLTGFLALIVAVYSNQRFVTIWSVVRPFVLYFLALVVICSVILGGIVYFRHQGVLEERAIIAEQVKAKVEADNKRLEQDKQALHDDLGMIQAENDRLKGQLERLPTPKQIIAHPRAAAKVFNDTMNGQFKRFEEITK